MCEPYDRCTPEHCKHMTVPMDKEAHSTLSLLQSTQLSFPSMDKIVANVSLFMVSARACVGRVVTTAFVSSNGFALQFLSSVVVADEVLGLCVSACGCSAASLKDIRLNPCGTNSNLHHLQTRLAFFDPDTRATSEEHSAQYILPHDLQWWRRVVREKGTVQPRHRFTCSSRSQLF